MAHFLASILAPFLTDADTLQLQEPIAWQPPPRYSLTATMAHLLTAFNAIKRVIEKKLARNHNAIPAATEQPAPENFGASHRELRALAVGRTSG